MELVYCQPYQNHWVIVNVIRIKTIIIQLDSHLIRVVFCLTLVPSPANILAACQYIGRYIEGFYQFISLVFKARKLDQEWQWGPYGSHLGPHIFLYDI
jgi:hypothetical protein